MPLYKGRRFWVFQNDPSNPFIDLSPEVLGQFHILVYDRVFEGLVAACEINEDGSIFGDIVIGLGDSFEAHDFRDMSKKLALTFRSWGGC